MSRPPGPHAAPSVWKVGGSLLDWPGLPSRLGAALEARGPDRVVLIVGGGRAADAVRELDRIHGLGEERAHALALRSLDLTAYVLAAIFPNLDVVDDPAALGPAWAAGRVPVLAPRRFLDADDSRPAPLPHTWAVTTDSIAARVADRLGAETLVLLKSAPLPPGLDRVGAARLGLVDPTFPAAAQAVPRVIYCNLRDSASTPADLA